MRLMHPCIYIYYTCIYVSVSCCSVARAVSIALRRCINGVGDCLGDVGCVGICGFRHRGHRRRPTGIVSRARRICERTYIAHAEKRGGGKICLVIWTGFCACCRNVGSTNQIAVSGDQRKQHLNITCSKCMLVLA